MIDIISFQEFLIRGIGALPNGLDRILVGGDQERFFSGQVKEEIKVGLLDTGQVEKVALLTKVELSVSIIPVLNTCALGKDNGVVAGTVREERGDLFAMELGGVPETGSGKHVGVNGME